MQAVEIPDSETETDTYDKPAGFDLAASETFLVTQKGDVHLSDQKIQKSEIKPWDLAFRVKTWELSQLILTHGFDVLLKTDTKNKNFSALFYLLSRSTVSKLVEDSYSSNCMLETFNLLMQNPEILMIRENEKNRSCLHYGSQRGHWQIVGLMLIGIEKYKLNLISDNEKLDQPLNNNQMCEKIDSLVSVNSADVDGRTPLIGG